MLGSQDGICTEMILVEAFYLTVEFYIIAAVIAAAIVGFMAVSKGPAPVRKLSLTSGPVICSYSSAPAITLEAMPDRSVTLTRTGLGDATQVILNINVKGFDVNIEEPILGASAPEGNCMASFTLDFMGAERYFVTYHNHNLGLFAALPFHNRPGIKTTKELK